MNQKTLTIVLVSASVLAIGGIVLSAASKNKKLAEARSSGTSYTGAPDTLNDDNGVGVTPPDKSDKSWGDILKDAVGKLFS